MASLTLHALLLVLLQVFKQAACFEQVADNQCSCYLTNETSAHYFTTHKFFDFRSLSQYAGVPPPVNDQNDSANAPETSQYFLDPDWTTIWSIQNWNNSDSLNSGTASVFMINSLSNLYIENNTDENPSSDTFMTMRTIRFDDFQSAAEFESVSNDFHFLSVRMYARTLGAPGAVTAMFTYRDSGDPDKLKTVQEADLEIRTIDPTDKVQYTNQPSYSADGDDIPAATRNATTPVQADWTQWSVHRLDWSPKNTTWFIDGNQAASIAFQVPRDPSQVIFNAWSDGGPWSGNMSVGTEAYLQIQWIEVVYNSTEHKNSHKRDEDSIWPLSKRSKGHCKNICSIDDSPTTGMPVLLYSGASSIMGHVLGHGMAHLWLPLLLATFLVTW
ncbi:glycoside hydrolase family 16 protein [Xylaria nigripes]|nr:glycoside hydrolase family 16 protein [Xylaria nigripes]